MEAVAAIDSTRELWVVRCGRVPYARASRAQELIAAARRAEAVPDVLLLLEHPPVYTRGRRADAAELPFDAAWYRERGIDIQDSDRGGRVTYHGPGQLVGYPIVSLRAYGNDVPGYVARMERVIVQTLAAWGVRATTLEGLTGVWTPQRRKIASIGIHVSRGVTRHGFAINVVNDLEPFGWIVPCGLDGCEMSSVARERDERVDPHAVADTAARIAARTYERSRRDVTVAELDGRVPGVASALVGSDVDRPRATATVKA